MKKLLAGLVTTLAFTAACSGPVPEEFTTKDAGTIRQQHDAYLKAFNAKEVQPIIDLYAENSVFMPPNEPIIRGKEALKNFYGDLFKRGATNLKMDITEVSGHGPLAYQSGNYEMELKPATGHARPRSRQVPLHPAQDADRVEAGIHDVELGPAADGTRKARLRTTNYWRR